jgi:hypothetical protein
MKITYNKQQPVKDEQTNNEIIQVLLSDIKDIQADIKEIKELLFKPTDSKFVEVGVKLASLDNRLSALTGDKIEYRSNG